jgi:hypothetical protein
MKIFNYIIYIFCYFSFSQSIYDGLRYSKNDITGTARYEAMSGAFGALGGDISAFADNPSGSSIFNHSQGNITFNISDSSTNTSFLNNNTLTSSNNFDFNQVGTVLVFNSNNKNDILKRFSVGFNYAVEDSFKNNWNAIAITDNSIANYFTDISYGVTLNEIENFNEYYSDFILNTAYLGYESYLMSPTSNDDENNEYNSNTGKGNFNLDHYVLQDGLKSRSTFNFSVLLNNNLSMGMNFNSHYLDYENITSTIETNTNEDANVNFINYENVFRARGNGFSFQIGGIYKTSKNLRIGLSYKSPTWFNIEEELSQNISTKGSFIVDGDNKLPVSIYDLPVMIFEPYKLRTPSKTTTSLAYVFKENGLISIDYSFTRYNGIKFSPSSFSGFNELNSEVKSNFKTTSALRVGGEYKIKRVSLRGGYRFEESPYKNSDIDNYLNSFSLGSGLNLGTCTIDFSYSRDVTDVINQLDYTNQPKVNSKTIINNYTVSINYNF